MVRYAPKEWLTRKLYGVAGIQHAGDDPFGDIVAGTDKHFNGSIGVASVGIIAYNRIPNDLKRKLLYETSKNINFKPGKIYQAAKSFSKSAGRVLNTAGHYGTILGVGAIAYDVMDDGQVKTSSIVNGVLIGVGLAFPVTAPFILAYGAADYLFDISGGLDSKFGSVNTHLHD